MAYRRLAIKISGVDFYRVHVKTKVVSLTYEEMN